MLCIGLTVDCCCLAATILHSQCMTWCFHSMASNLFIRDFLSHSQQTDRPNTYLNISWCWFILFDLNDWLHLFGYQLTQCGHQFICEMTLHADHSNQDRSCAHQCDVDQNSFCTIYELMRTRTTIAHRFAARFRCLLHRSLTPVWRTEPFDAADWRQKE